MNNRRTFLKLASSAAVPAAAAVVSSGVARADDGNEKDFLGAWSTIHMLPFPPGQFREFLSFADGGVLHETNSFLHTNSNTPGLLDSDIVNASDGVGNWQRVRNGAIQAVFRKMLFNGARVNFGDLYVQGMLHLEGPKLVANWQVMIVDVHNNVLRNLGSATSEGFRLQ